MHGTKLLTIVSVYKHTGVQSRH